MPNIFTISHALLQQKYHQNRTTVLLQDPINPVLSKNAHSMKGNLFCSTQY